jgi:phosphoglycolate phosphatase
MDLVIFDLDGTLIDSKLDLAHAVNAALRHLGVAELPHELIATYVGNGAPVLMRRALGPDASEDEVERALAYFLAYYNDHRLDYTRLYPGVRESLDRLRDGGVRMAVLTNKPVRISRLILDGLGVASHFFQVYGGNSFEQKKPHPVGVDTLRHEARVGRERTLFVGDSAVDVKTARNAGIACCGVTFGFQPETFDEEPPDFLVDRMEKMAEEVLARRVRSN